MAKAIDLGWVTGIWWTLHEEANIVVDGRGKQDTSTAISHSRQNWICVHLEHGWFFHCADLKRGFTDVCMLLWLTGRENGNQIHIHFHLHSMSYRNERNTMAALCTNLLKWKMGSFFMPTWVFFLIWTHPFCFSSSSSLFPLCSDISEFH